MLSLSGFSGEIPRIAPRLLPDSAAQVAINCKLVDGTITPLRHPAPYRKLAPGNIMFYKRGATWFEWNKIVDVAQAPVADSRLYVTGDDVPKLVVDSTTIYPIAVQRPENALVAAVTGTPDPVTQETVVYAYTYVTAFDEESEPSPLSNEVVRSAGMDVTLTGFEAAPAGRNYNRIRIYRSQTSAMGVTDLYFIREMYFPVPTPSWVDEVESNPIMEPCPSTNYNPPPDDLTGIIALPNGMMAGFVGKKLYFSEPWVPHAWPEKYVLTTNYDIVGLGVFGSSIAVMTTGQPYLVTGIQPDAMAMDRLEVNYPCVNKRGIVDLGYSVAYPSTDGLVVISSQGARLATRELFTRDKWAKFSPETMIAAQYDGRYIASYSYSDPSGVTSQGIAIIDMTGETPFFSRVDRYIPYMFFEEGSGKLYGLDGEIAVEWDALNQPFMSYIWRSKKFVMNGHTNFGVVLVDGDTLSFGYGDPTAIPTINIDDGLLVNGVGTTGAFGDPIAPSPIPFQATVYADGSVVRSFSDFNKVARLPGGFLARTWEIEVRGNRAVSAIYLAFAPSELSPEGGVQ